MTLTTTFVNETAVDFKLKEGNAGVYREVTTLKGLKKGDEPSAENKHSLEFDEKATYREYRTVSTRGTQRIQITSDFCLDHSTIYIWKNGSKYDIRGNPRSKSEGKPGHSIFAPFTRLFSKKA